MDRKSNEKYDISTRPYLSFLCRLFKDNWELRSESIPLQLLIEFGGNVDVVIQNFPRRVRKIKDRSDYEGSDKDQEDLELIWKMRPLLDCFLNSRMREGLFRSRSHRYFYEAKKVEDPEKVWEEEDRKIKRMRKSIKEFSFDDFKKVKRISLGVFGATYLATTSSHGGNVFVIKIYHKACRMSREEIVHYTDRDALTLVLGFHPNVVPILSSSYDEEVIRKHLPDRDEHAVWPVNKFRTGMIVMRYHKESLEQYLDIRNQDNPLTCIEISRITLGILQGSQYLQKNMIVHRDLHPGNIFIDDEEGRVWIGDFGCALDLKNNKHRFKVHKNDEILMKPLKKGKKRKKYVDNEELYKRYIGGASSFSAPEIRNFDRSREEFLDFEKADLYSIGVLINEMLKRSKRRFESMTVLHRVLMDIRTSLMEEDPRQRMKYDTTIRLLIRSMEREELVESPFALPGPASPSPSLTSSSSGGGRRSPFNKLIRKMSGKTDVPVLEIMDGVRGDLGHEKLYAESDNI